MAAKRSSEQERFEEYLNSLGRAVGHADRREPLRAYLVGLLLPGERKSVEPMAAKIDPWRIGSRHQSMHHFVAKAPWEEQEVLRAASDYALAQLERHGPVEAWVVDDTGMPKKGRWSVGVGRQYCGALGKQENCQVAVSVSLVNDVASVPCAYRLYLPKGWFEERRRWERAGIPKTVRFQTKWEIALEEIDRLQAEQLPPAPVVADAGYGEVTAFRDGLSARQLSYAVGIPGEITVWLPDSGPQPTPRRQGSGRPAKLLRRPPGQAPVAVLELARSLPVKAFKTVAWREGTRGRMSSRFARLQVRVAHGDEQRSELRPLETLLIEWPQGEPEPTKFWLSTLPEEVEMEDLIRLVKIRWRIERDFQELKDELGLDHYEGRGWRGFHHHGVLCIAAYAFLAAERARLSPPAPLAFLQPAALPKDFRPRGAARAS